MKMGSFFHQKNKHVIMVNEEHGDSGSNSSSSDVSNCSDLFEEVNSSSSSSLSYSPTRSNDALHDMSSLLQELPIKRGLSKHYNGKSQSFTTLSNVRSLEDLAKPEHPYNKKLKSCKSYQEFDENNNNGSNNHLLTAARRRSGSTKLIKKASSRGGPLSSFCSKRNGSFNSGIDRPPLIPPALPPQKSDCRNNFNKQSPLFPLGL